DHQLQPGGHGGVGSLLSVRAGRKRRRWRLLGGQVGAEVLDRDVLVGAVGLDVGQRLVDGFAQLRVALADQHARFAEFGALVAVHDLYLGVGLVLLEVQERQVVVDGGVHAARGQQVDAFIEALHGHHLGAVFLGQLAEVAGQGVGRALALQVVEALDVRVVVAHDQHRLRRDVGVRKIVLGLAGIGNAYLVDDRVVALDVQAGDQAVPFAFDEFGLDAQALGDGLADLDVEAGKLAGGIVVGEGGVGALGADLEHAGRFDVGQAVLGMGAGGDGQLQQAGQQNGTQGFHEVLQWNVIMRARAALWAALGNEYGTVTSCP